MMKSAVLTTRAATTVDIPTIQTLARAQAARYAARDPRLPRIIHFPRWLIYPDGGGCWLAHDEMRLVGALSVVSEFWEEDSAFANVFPRRCLRMRLSAAAESDSLPVLEALLPRVDRWPGAARVPGRMITVPTCDVEAADALDSLGFSPYHTVAYRSVDPPSQIAPDDVRVRVADLTDAPAVGALMAESWRFHAEHQPAIELTSRLDRQCRQQAEQLTGDGFSSTLLVAERESEIVGFFGIALNFQDPAVRPAFFERGRYGDILEVAVRSDQRRQGIGAAMFRAAQVWFAEHEAEAMFVNYAPTNPVSSRFWPKLGFVDAWTTWWRA